MDSFEEQLEKHVHEPWRFEYVAYSSIRRDLKKRLEEQQQPWTTKDELRFQKVLELEAYKVEQFIRRKQREIESQIRYCDRKLSSSSTDTVSSVESALTDLLLDLNELSKFTRYNFISIQKLIEEHDRLVPKTSSSHPSQLLIDLSRKIPLDKQRFDVMLLRTSSLLDLARRKAGKAPDEGERAASNHHPTARYWVHADNLTEVKAVLLYNLMAIGVVDHGNPRTTTKVYLDNSNFDLYLGRLQRDEGAEEISIKWRGSPQDCQSLSVERQVYRAPWLNGLSAHDAITVDNQRLGTLLTPIDPTPSEERNDTANSDSESSARSIQECIRSKNLHPVFRVTYNELDFQSPEQPGISVSLSADVVFEKELVDRGTWHSTTSTTAPQDRYQFPHAILSVIISQKAPDWLTQLLDSHLIFEVPRFTKFLHGRAYFWNLQVPLLPWWTRIIDSTDIRYRLEAICENDKSGLLPRSASSRGLRSLEDSDHPVGYLETQLERYATLHRPKTHDSSAIHHREPLNPDAYVVELDDGRRKSVSEQNIAAVNQRTAAANARVGRLRGIPKNNNGQEPGGKKKKKNGGKKGPKLEPKVFFANERTFIHWLFFAALILMSALTLLNFGDHISTITGGVFFGIAMLITLYAFGRYRYRAHLIATKPQFRYDDIYGPIGLCILLVGALVVSTYIATICSEEEYENIYLFSFC